MRRALLFLVVVAVTLAVPGHGMAGDLAVQLTAPAAGSELGGTVHLAAAAPQATEVVFQWSPDGGTSWHHAATDSTKADGWHAPWDSGTFDGKALFRAVATNGTAKAVSQAVAATIDNTAPDVTVSASPAVFSPNGDGVLDRVAVSVTASEASSLDVAVTGPGGRVVHRIARGLAAEAGTTHLAWGGLTLVDGEWRRAPDGVYLIRATAADAVGNRASSPAAQVVLDTTSPSVAWRSISPEPQRGTGPMAFAYTSSDRTHLMRVAVGVWDPFGRVAFLEGTRQYVGDREVRWAPAYSDGSPLIPGLYRARITLTDAAGNVALSPFSSFRVLRPVTTSAYRDLTDVGNRVALTFDDCISGTAWDDILDVLDRHQVKATFFCTGQNVERHPSQARRAVADGMTIGSHTRDHALLTSLTFDQVRAEVVYDENVWWRVARTTPAPYFRPPYGAYNQTVLDAAGSAGYLRMVLWDVDPQDWQNPGPSVIADRVLSHAHAGMIVVMHVQGQTADALPAILQGLAARDLQQVGIADLFRAAGYR